MDILTGVTQAAAIVNTTRDMIQALKPGRKASAGPALTGATKLDDAQTRTRFLAELDKASTRFIQLRDFDGNGSLNAIEFGEDRQAFARLDANADGELSVAELNQAALANLHVRLGANPDKAVGTT